MGYRTPSTASKVLQNASFPVNTETAALISDALNLPFDNSLVIIQWQVTYTGGSTGASLTPRLRRGNTVAGTLLNVAVAVTMVATNAIQLCGVYFDLPGSVAGVQYTLSLNPPGGGTAGTLNDGCIIAMVL